MGVICHFTTLPFAFSQIPADTASPGFLITNAVEKGNLSGCQKLIATDSMLIHTVEPKNGESLLHVAARYDQPEVVAWLLKKGLPVNQPNRYGNAPLHLAVFSGSGDLVKLLIDAGADVKARNQKGRTPLEYVSYGHNPLLFNYFIAIDSNILLLKSSEGAGLLHWASVAGDTAGFSFLVKQGLNVHEEDFNGANVVHWAYSGGDKTMLRYLKMRGLDYRKVSSKGFSSITAAIMRKNRNVIEFLLEDEHDVDFRFPPDNNTLFLEACSQDAVEIAELLIGRGADVNASDHAGFTALCWSLINHNLEMSRFLLEKGADPNHRIKDGRTPALVAVDRDSIAQLGLLAGHGADFSVTDTSGVGAVQQAVIKGNMKLLSFLLQQGVRVNTSNRSGLTPLHYAAIYGRVEAGEALLRQGADVNMPDPAGLTPACYSQRYGQQGMTALLHASGGASQGPNHCTEPKTSIKIESGEAIVHYLNHSGFAVETSHHFLIFDYYHSTASSESPSLANGRMNPNELKGKQMVVFVSHEHSDHYDTAIWAWGQPDRNIRYVLGLSPEKAKGYELAVPHQPLVVDGVGVFPIKSTDLGVGFLVETDGVVIYHPGDHINKESGLASAFTSEVDYLAGLGKDVDIAFFPVAGCGFPDMEIVKTGNLYTIGKLNPRWCCPMHASESLCRKFAAEINLKYPTKRVFVGSFPGDHFTCEAD